MAPKGVTDRNPTLRIHPDNYDSAIRTFLYSHIFNLDLLLAIIRDDPTVASTDNWAPVRSRSFRVDRYSLPDDATEATYRIVENRTEAIRFIIDFDDKDTLTSVARRSPLSREIARNVTLLMETINHDGDAELHFLERSLCNESTLYAFGAGSADAIESYFEAHMNANKQLVELWPSGTHELWIGDDPAPPASRRVVYSMCVRLPNARWTVHILNK